MARAVRFDRFGGLDVLEVVEVARPRPGPGQLLVEVRAAGLNPGESAIREGRLEEEFPTSFPCGQGSDLAGVVVAAGSGVARVSVGDEVVGFTDERASQADLVVVPEDQLVGKPAAVPWDQAGALKVAGTTAYASIRAAGAGDGDVVVVSGAAGGVGSLAVQLARRRGASVIGLAGPEHHQWLLDHGAHPLDYTRPDLADAVRGVYGRVDAFVDTYGDGYVALALDLGIAPGRITTTIDFAAVRTHGVQAAGGSEASSADVLEELVGLMASGQLEVPIAAAYPIEAVRTAYRQLEQRHTLGKIVLVMQQPAAT